MPGWILTADGSNYAFSHKDAPFGGHNCTQHFLLKHDAVSHTYYATAAQKKE